jgi:raffinose/stachyose/melibiose transport system permease protein
MIGPILFLYIVFCVFPLLFTAIYSFTDWSSYSSKIRIVGLDNYLSLFKDNILILGTKNSLLFAIANVILQSAIALPVAIVLNSKILFRNIFRAVFFSPAVVSILVVGYLWSYILSSREYGLVNSFLVPLGINSINFLGSVKLVWPSIMLTQLWQWFGWAMVVYIGNLQSIPQELYEAASIDGCKGLRRFWFIILPQLTPSLKINLVSGLTSGLKIFDIVFSMTKGGPGHATETILLLMYTRFSEGNYGYAASFGIAFLVLSLILTLLLMQGFKIWEDKLE